MQSSPYPPGQDFDIFEDLQFDLSWNRPTIQIRAKSLAGETQTEVKLSFGADEIESVMESSWLAGKSYLVRHSSGPSATSDAIADLGLRLFHETFDGPLHAFYRDTLALAERKNRGCRFRFSTDNPRLFDYPWELLFDPTRRDFLGLSSRVSILRSRPKGFSAEPLIPLPFLRILAIDGDFNGQMQTTQEIETLAKVAASSNRMSVQVVAQATRESAIRAIVGGAYDVIHFAGSGVNSARRPPRIEQSLALLGSGSGPSLLTAEDLASALRDAPSVRLVVLNGCYTNWMARRLSKEVPAVTGMRGDIGAAECVTFGRAFYSALSAGRVMESALTSARQQMELGSPGTRQWCLCTAYLQRPEGVMLGAETPAGKSVPDNIQLEIPLEVAGQFKRLSRLKEMYEANLASLEQKAMASSFSSETAFGSQIAELKDKISEVVNKLSAIL